MSIGLGCTMMGGAKSMPLSIAAGLAWLLMLNEQTTVNGHGYLSSPRSRNLLAFEETVWWPQTSDDPEPETCPHCLNRGGSLAQCGIFGGRNYDSPKNALGGPLPTKIQAEYTQGQEVVLDVTLTAHHKGHFVFSACPISAGDGKAPTQECFDGNKLTFVEDLVHGANFDPNYPERAYIAPVDDDSYVLDEGSSQGVMFYSFKMRLPPNVYGDLVLIQWYYLTANSCYHDGYQQYNWPSGWRIDATSSGKCGQVSSDGDGAPEQFWNCAEVKISQATNPFEFDANPIPAPKPSPVEISSGISIPVSLPFASQNTGGNNNSPSSAGPHGKTIVGYYASWQWYDRNKKAAPENMDFTKVQRVNFAFFQTDEQGNMWGTDSWADPNLLFGPYNWNPPAGQEQYCSWDSPSLKNCQYHNYEQGLIHLVHAAGAEIYPSLGGWTLSDAFVAMAASASARAKFTQNCIDLINEYGFDGIDIDWEYPGYADHSGTPQDRDNFKLLLNDVRAALDNLGALNGKFYGLTAALPCGPQHIQNMDIAHVASTLSELNLMTYDFHGAFSETSGTNAPLYDQGWGEEDFDVHSCVQNWLAGGGSRDKINIGLPFYGRSVGVATGLNQPHNGADKSIWGIDDGTPQYFNIVDQLPFMTSVWDKKTWTQYAYFDAGGFVSYDDENAICAKVQYAQEHNLNGFIIWELSGDMMDDLSTPLLDVTIEKLYNPDYNCGEPGFYPEGNEIGTPVAPEISPTVPIGSPPGAFERPPTAMYPPPVYPTPVYPPPVYPTPVYPTPVYPTPVYPTPVYPTPVYPTPVSSPWITIPSEPVVTPPVSNQPENDQPVAQTNGQPDMPPSFVSPVYDKPILLLCGDQQVPFNENDSKPLGLSFRYELHRNSGVPISYALKDFKNSLLNGIAEKLNCVGASSAVRRLRSNLVETSQETVIAIKSDQSDLPEGFAPCLVPVVLDGQTTCDSVIGSLIVYVEEGTPATRLSEVQKELLFYIRTSMAADTFDSLQIRKVIYIENLGPDPLESNTAPPIINPNTNMMWQPQSEPGGNSHVLGIVLSLLVIALIGFTLFIFVVKKRMSESPNPEERAIVEGSERTTDSTEGTWRKALHTEEVWKGAINTYEGKSAESDIYSDDAGRGTSPAEPQVASWSSWLEGEKTGDPPESYDGCNQHESFADYDEAIAASKKKKKHKQKKKKRSLFGLGPDEKMQGSASDLIHEQNHFDIGDIEGGGKAVEQAIAGQTNRRASTNDGEEGGHNHNEDPFGTNSCLDAENVIKLPASTTGAEGNGSYPDLDNENDGNQASASSQHSNEPDKGNQGAKPPDAPGESPGGESWTVIPQASEDEYEKKSSADYGLD